MGEDEGEDFTLEAGSIIVAGVVPRLHQVVGAIEEAISEAEVSLFRTYLTRRAARGRAGNSTHRQ